LDPSSQAVSRRKVPSEPDERIGGEIRALRKAKGLTLRALAGASGRTAGYLSQIENGVVTPSIETMTRLAEALGVELSWFFPNDAGPNERERNIVVRAESRRRLSHMYSFDTTKLGYQDFLLSADLGLELFMGLSRFEPGERTLGAQAATRGHICGYVLSGRAKLVLDDEEFLIATGDSFSFDMMREHEIINAHSDTTEVIWAISPVRLDF
jgi:transcriptional regulator with XRE-family HTH domain